MERDIVTTVGRLRAGGVPYLVATVVRVTGSAYRRPGARLVMTRDGWAAGAVSGGCLERDLLKTAWWRIGDCVAAVARYDARVLDGDDDVDLRARFGVGCDGIVDVLLERGDAAGRFDAVGFGDACARAERRGAIATVIGSRDPRVAVGARWARAGGDVVIGDALPEDLAWPIERALDAAVAAGATRSHKLGDGLDVLVEAVVPPPALFVFGGRDAEPVVALASGLGWQVSAGVPRRGDGIDAACALIDRCDRAFAVVMNHDYVLDRRCVAALRASRARYIGVLGPRKRTARLLGELGDDAAADPRIHAPVGLDLGAETAAEIALAIVAEVQAVVAHAGEQPLRDGTGAIHVEVAS